MPTHQNAKWPSLLIDGGWKTLRSPVLYWPTYKRHTATQTFYIERDNETPGWILSESTRGRKKRTEIFRGNLDECLTRGNI